MEINSGLSYIQGVSGSVRQILAPFKIKVCIKPSTTSDSSCPDQRTNSQTFYYLKQWYKQRVGTLQGYKSHLVQRLHVSNTFWHVLYGEKKNFSSRFDNSGMNT